MDLAFYGAVFVTLLVIIDPPGIVPVFLGLTRDRPRPEISRLARTAVLTSFAVGVVALKLLLGLVARGRLQWFAVYCALLGTGVIVWRLWAPQS